MANRKVIFEAEEISSGSIWWDRVLNWVGTLVIPVAIVVVGGRISANIAKSQVDISKIIAESQLVVTKQIAESQIEAAKLTSQNQLIKDYISMLAEAAGKGNERGLSIILASLKEIKSQSGIPGPIQAALIKIGDSGKWSKGILQSISELVSPDGGSPDDGQKAREYFRNKFGDSSGK